MNPRLLVATALAVVLVASQAQADPWEAYERRQYLSANGKYELYVDDTLHAGMFEVGEPCRLIGEFNVPVLPLDAFVSGDGQRIVFVDTDGGNSKESPGFLLLDAKGVELRRFAIRELVDVEEPEINWSMSGVEWFEEKSTGLTADEGVFLITTKSGHALAFDKETGNRVNPSPKMVAVAHARESRLSAANEKRLLEFKTDEVTRAVAHAMVGVVSFLPDMLDIHLWRNHAIEISTPDSGSKWSHGAHRIGIYCGLHMKAGHLILKFQHQAWESYPDRLVAAIDAWEKCGAVASQIWLVDGGFCGAHLKIVRERTPFNVDVRFDARTAEVKSQPTLAEFDRLVKALAAQKAIPTLWESAKVKFAPVVFEYGKLHVQLPGGNAGDGKAYAFDTETGELQRD